MKAIRRDVELKQAIISKDFKINNTIKKSVLKLVIDINTRTLAKEKKALMDIANEEKTKLTRKQASNLKEYIQDNKEIKPTDKREYLDTINMLSYGYIIR